MLSSLIFAVFLLSTSITLGTGESCLCSVLPPAGLRVNCSSLNLVKPPQLPSDATELHMQGNRLTSVAPGLFDRLTDLRKVSLSENPFHCDCGIQYLRNWLLKNKAIVTKEPVCVSPGSVAHKPIAQLPDEYFSSCALARCSEGRYGVAVGGMLGCLILLLLWSLRLARRSTFTLYIDQRHSGFQGDSLRSLRPKHRRRLRTGLSDISSDLDSVVLSPDLDGPLLNMDLLPQVLDVLHKKHNIKIKAT